MPDVIRDDWKKWWEAAKRELKKDGHFQVPLKKTDPILYQAKEVSLQDRLLEEFRSAKGLKARGGMKVGAEGERQAKAQVRVALFGVMKAIGLKGKRTQPTGRELVLVVEQHTPVVRIGLRACRGQGGLLDQVVLGAVPIHASAQEPLRAR